MVDFNKGIVLKLLKIITNFIYWLAIILLVFIALGTAFSVLEAPGGYRAFVVQSGSMEPVIKTGSVVVIFPQKKYQKDEIITFLSDLKADLKKAGSTVTHRIVAVHDDNERATFSTKGDANEDKDRETVTEQQVLGKVVFGIPYLGYAVDFAKTQTGFIALIVIPGTLIIYSELMNIKKEIARLVKDFEVAKFIKEFKEKRKKKEKKVEKIKSKPKAKKKKKKTRKK